MKLSIWLPYNFDLFSPRIAGLRLLFGSVLFGTVYYSSSTGRPPYVYCLPHLLNHRRAREGESEREITPFIIMCNFVVMYFRIRPPERSQIKAQIDNLEFILDHGLGERGLGGMLGERNWIRHTQQKQQQRRLKIESWYIYTYNAREDKMLAIKTMEQCKGNNKIIFSPLCWSAQICGSWKNTSSLHFASILWL